MWAVAERHSAVVRVLIEGGADVRARTAVRPRRVNTERGGFNGATATDIEKGGYSPLLFAAQQGDLESIELLIAAGADVDEKAPEGTSALVVAAHSGHGAAARLLLDKGADPAAAGAGYTALHAAILHGDVDLVQALLARGVSPNAPLVKATPLRRNSADYGFEANLVGATPFWLAARFLEPPIMRALLAKGADPSFVMNDGTTALAAAIQARRTVEPGFAADPIRDESLALEAAQITIANGADVNAADKDGDTALHAAVQRRLNSVVQLLVEKGASLDAKNQKGQTPLAIAAAAGGPNQPNPTADLLRKLGAQQ
jgi:ankyrin repeat protein